MILSFFVQIKPTELKHMKKIKKRREINNQAKQIQQICLI